MASLMPWRQLYYAILASDRSWKPPGRDQRATARGKDPTDVERWAHSSLLSLLMCFSLTKSKIWELNISIQFYTYLNILSATQISVPITGQISLCLSAQAVAAEAQFRPSLLFTMGKPRGIRCARKLRVHRKEALWPTRSFWMLLARFGIRSLDIWHRRKIARFLPVFATFHLGCFSWRTTRRQTWVPSTSAILSEANLLQQRVCLSEKSRMLYLARWFVDSKNLVSRLPA